QLHILGVNLQNRFAAANVRKINHDLPVKAARTEKGRVKNIGPVRCSNDDDPFLSIEAIHLDEQRVQGLFTFIVAATETMTTTPTHGINFVDEDQAGRILACLFEHVADAAGADTHEHFNEIRTTDAEEGCVGLASDCFGQKSLACARRA